MSFEPNQFRRAEIIDQPATYRAGRWELFEPRAPVTRILSGKPWRLRPGLTFTPYANPTACNAHCAFCSEELLRKDGTRLTAKTTITDLNRYFAGLHRAWSELAGFEMGLSLSGLEATSSPPWMLRLLDLVGEHTALFPEKVLYSNGTGLSTHPPLIARLQAVGFDRVELSRCHLDEDVNQRIMRFNRGEPIWKRSAFDDLIAALHDRVTVKLSCILTSAGVSTVSDIEDYIDQAADLGVTQIVFRELSQLGDAYFDNRFSSWIAENRVDVRTLMAQIQPEADELRPGWEFLGATSGYYYYNEVYRRRGVTVRLEVSSYIAHHNAHQTGVLQKLVFHSTGDLCGDWVPSALHIGNYY
ncbi:MAG: MoaA/NifB/PqqE/SkfB family radical SAM enzyme [Myxococcota bacterium]|jgi:MoaA/NifB/PqqE/SkfB family radical SAM enzyme